MTSGSRTICWQATSAALWAEVLTAQRGGRNSLYTYEQLISKAMQHIWLL
jgi:hypothetical protein